MHVKMLKTIEIDGEEFVEGSTVELDETDATKWIESKRCEKTGNPAEALYEKVTAAVDEKINKAVEKIAASISVKTDEPKITFAPESKNLGDFCKLFATDQTKLRAKYGEKVLSIGTDTAVLPTPMLEEVLQARKGVQDVLGLTRQHQMTSDTLKIPVLNQAGVSPSGGASAYFGGVVGAFDSEDDDANDTEPAWAAVTLNAAKYTMSTLQTLEFRQDSVAPEQNLVQLFGEAYRDHMSYFVLNGASNVIGIIDHAGTVSVNRATVSTIKHTDVVKMLGRRASVGGNWTWIVSNTGYSKLLELETSSGYPVFQPQLHNALYGLPIQVCEHAATLGSSGDLILANLQMGYAFGNRMQAEISFSDHVYFAKGKRMWKLEARIGGQPVHADTLTLADGSTEAADIIQLDAAIS